jgi:hypothetical protein
LIFWTAAAIFWSVANSLLLKNWMLELAPAGWVFERVRVIDETQAF